MGEEKATQPKWEGKVSAKLRGPKAEQIWPLIEDFIGINKWLPGIETSKKVEGVYGQPGLIRYTASAPTSDADETVMTIKWCKEKLIEIDPIQRSLSYEIMDNNVGFKSYVGTIKVSPINGDDDEKEKHSCLIEWSYMSDPNEYWPLDGFISYMESSVLVMAERMEKALQPGN